jgi:selenocysteine lyase/cysteine desulfurase
MLINTTQLFGPHISCLAVSPWSPLAGKSVHSLGHYFHPQSVAYKFAPGGASYELQVGCHAVLPYLLSLGDATSDLPQSRQLDVAFQRIQAHEKLLSDRLLSYLLSEQAKAKGVRVIGPETSHDRAPTISFVVLESAESKGTDAIYKKRLLSKDIVSVFDEGKKVGLGVFPHRR